MTSSPQTLIRLALIAVLLCTGVVDAGLRTSCCCDRHADGERLAGETSSCCHAPRNPATLTAARPACCQSERCGTEGRPCPGSVQSNCQCACGHAPEPVCSARVQSDEPEGGTAVAGWESTACWPRTVAALAIDRVVAPTISAQRLLCVWRL